MTPQQITLLVQGTNRYNLHSHTQYCDGRATMEQMAGAAAQAGFKVWGFSPHAPICVESPCNMTYEAVPGYLNQATELASLYAGRMDILTGMEVDYISAEFGPHIDYFQNLPLDFRIGSVHFVPTQEGVAVDCDGNAERFTHILGTLFHNDLRYVVEKYYEQVLNMLERGGFEILGHFDKIAGNATAVDPEIESQGWYRALVDDVISHCMSSDCLVEINTKAYDSRQRFYPAEWIWPAMSHLSKRVVINSDAHYPDRIDSNRPVAFHLWQKQSERLLRHSSSHQLSTHDGFGS